jgi:DNA-binding response OmpR family regulator
MKRSRHVLIVGADAALRDTLAQPLESDGNFRVTDTAGDAEAIMWMQERKPLFDAIIVLSAAVSTDVNNFCMRLRRRGLRVPIVVLSDSLAEQDVVDALNAGATDYLVLPFRLAELKARLRAHIRDYENCEHAVLTLGPYHFRPGARLLHEPIENRRIRLTQKEVTILKCLHRATGTPLSRQAMLREVWSYSAKASTQTVESHIYRLRRKIEPDPSRPSVILHDGGGYRLGQDANV